MFGALSLARPTGLRLYLAEAGALRSGWRASARARSAVGGRGRPPLCRPAGVRPSGEVRAMPAVQEPTAMPTWGAAPLRPDARVGAEPAKRRASAPSAGFAAKPVTPMSVTRTTVVTGLVERTDNNSRISVVVTAAVMSVARGATVAHAPADHGAQQGAQAVAGQDHGHGLSGDSGPFRGGARCSCTSPGHRPSAVSWHSASARPEHHAARRTRPARKALRVARRQG